MYQKKPWFESLTSLKNMFKFSLFINWIKQKQTFNEPNSNSLIGLSLTPTPPNPISHDKGIVSNTRDPTPKSVHIYEMAGVYRHINGCM